MILEIVPELNSELIVNAPANVKVIDYNAFNTLDIHPFIATNNWEVIRIILGRGIQSGYIKQTITRSKNIEAVVPNGLELDFEIISRLMEILPTASSEIRSAYMKKQDVEGILKREGVIFE